MNRRLTTLTFTHVALLFAVGSFFNLAPAASAANWTVRAQPTRLVNGAPVLFQVKPPAQLDSLHGTWLGHEVSFSFDPASKTWFALAGVSLETAPGSYALELTGETTAGKTPSQKISFTRKFTVAAGKYPKIEVKLSVRRQVHRTHPRAAETNRRRSGGQEGLSEPGHARARVVGTIHRARRS